MKKATLITSIEQAHFNRGLKIHMVLGHGQL